GPAFQEASTVAAFNPPFALCTALLKEGPCDATTSRSHHLARSGRDCGRLEAHAVIITRPGSIWPRPRRRRIATASSGYSTTSPELRRDQAVNGYGLEAG